MSMHARPTPNVLGLSAPARKSSAQTRRMCTESASTRSAGIEEAIVGAIALGGLFALAKSVQVVPANHVGIYDLFGVVREEPLRSGLHFVNPMANLHVVSCKTDLQDYTAVVPSKEGLNVEVHFAVQFHLDESQAVDLYKTVGLDYVQKVVQPQVKAAVRKATSTRDAKALYTSEREMVKADMLQILNEALNPRGVFVEDVPLKQIVLPAKLSAAIESKLQMEQESQRMDFVLQKEQQEAQRKRIEAQGISDFQRIVSNGIDERLLRWKGIEATVDLAKSPNAKVVVVGQGKDGLPLILGK